MSRLFLLKEDFADFKTQQVIEESTGAKRWFIEGITLQSEVKNHNGRVYPKDVLSRAINDHVESYLRSGRAVGELDHPVEKSAQISPENISHKFVSVKEDGNNFCTKAQLLDTPKGKIAQSLLDAEVRLGISSRGLGSLKESNGAKVVQEFQIISLGDIVFEPSGPDCFMNSMMEGREWLYENGKLVQVDLSEDMDKWQKTLRTASAKDVQAAASKVLSEYITKLLKNK